MITIENLNFSYTGNPPYILQNINFNIPKGSYISIIGENGSAKSTLMKLILKILKPCHGTIKINTGFVGYVPQRVESFNSQFPITVTEVLNCHKKTLKIRISASYSSRSRSDSFPGGATWGFQTYCKWSPTGKSTGKMTIYIHFESFVIALKFYC